MTSCECEECGEEVPGEDTHRRAGFAEFFCSSGCLTEYYSTEDSDT